MKIAELRYFMTDIYTEDVLRQTKLSRTDISTGSLNLIIKIMSKRVVILMDTIQFYSKLCGLWKWDILSIDTKKSDKYSYRELKTVL